MTTSNPPTITLHDLSRGKTALLWLFFVIHKDAAGIVEASYEEIHDATGLSPATIAGLLSHLRDLGAISKLAPAENGRMRHQIGATLETEVEATSEIEVKTVTSETEVEAGTSEIEVPLSTTSESEVALSYIERESDLEDPTEATSETEVEAGTSEIEVPPKVTAKHPAIQAFRNAAHRYPAKAWYERIALCVGEEPGRIAAWEENCMEWVGFGWNPSNVKGMLERFASGGQPPRNGASPQGARTRGAANSQRMPLTPDIEDDIDRGLAEADARRSDGL